jgi:hypothetical protein
MARVVLCHNYGSIAVSDPDSDSGQHPKTNRLTVDQVALLVTFVPKFYIEFKSNGWIHRFLPE